MNSASTYNFKASNWVVFVLTIIFSVIGAGFCIGAMSNYGIISKGNTFLILVCIAVIFFLVFFLVRLTSFAKVEMTLSQNSLSIKWLEGFLFFRKNDVTIEFKDIADYVSQGDSNWDWIKIKLIDETIYRIWHSNFFTKDDYGKFVSAFSRAVENYNESITDRIDDGDSIQKNKKINLGKTIYETTWGLILGIIGIIMIIGAPILFLVIPTDKTPNYTLIGVGYVGAIYFVAQVYRYRWQRK